MIDENEKVSPKSWIVTLLLFIFVHFGSHRFYVGKFGTGILWLLTFGCFGIGSLVDLVKICSGTFEDKEGLPIKPPGRDTLKGL